MKTSNEQKIYEKNKEQCEGLEDRNTFNEVNLLKDININDLTHFNDGTVLNIEENSFTNENRIHDILKEDINEFIKNKKDKKFTLNTKNDKFGEMNFENTNININGREASHIMQNTKLGQKLSHILQKSQSSSLGLSKRKEMDTKCKNLKYKEKLLKIEFEKKMRRIKKIKSKSHKKLRQRANSAVDKMELMNKCEDLSDSIENSSNDEDSREEANINEENLLNPLVSFQNKRNDEDMNENMSVNKNLVDEAFNINNDEDSFEMQKNEIQVSNGPKVNVKVIPGLNVWGGEGIVTKRTAKNTIKEFSEGIVKLEDRKDFNKSNVIINEEIEINSKYKTKNNNLKYNDKIKMDYNEIKKHIKNQIPIGKEIGIKKYIEK